MAVAFITHPHCRLHRMGDDHPEQPARLGAIEDELHVRGLHELLLHREAPRASVEQLVRVHPLEYVEKLADLSVLFASLIGTTIEFFDFYIYATAAVLVFPEAVLPGSDAGQRHAAIARHLRARVLRAAARFGAVRPLSATASAARPRWWRRC
jgi:acetoin utilization deacetylase AcuC-like enzyme